MEEQRKGGIESLQAQAEAATVVYLRISEASRRARGKDEQLRAAENAAAFMVGRCWGLYATTQAELMQIKAKRELNIRLTLRERATWTLYGSIDQESFNRREK